jgi:HAD superfamily hydrolase (TIGR01509 family)
MKIILCDIGGVLLNVHFNRAIDRLSNVTGLAEEALMDRIFSSGIKDNHDLGLISPQEFYEKIIPENNMSFEEFAETWANIFSENQEMVEFIKSCSGKHKLYIASNTDPIHFDFFNEKYSWFSLFDGYGLSYKLKTLKPSPDFHINLCREFGIDFKDAYFVDDLPENIDAANRLGIKSHLFNGVDAFKEFVERK